MSLYKLFQLMWINLLIEDMSNAVSFGLGQNEIKLYISSFTAFIFDLNKSNIRLKSIFFCNYSTNLIRVGQIEPFGWVASNKK
jgi:hypothetical protein